MKTLVVRLGLALALLSLSMTTAAAQNVQQPAPTAAAASSAQPAAPAAAAEDLRSPARRSTRYSAYALPHKTWSLEVGALGMNEELYGLLGFAYGLGKGFELHLNLLHYSVGLFNIGVRWNFFDSKYVALGSKLDFSYGHGDWVWIVNPPAQKILEHTDLISIPVGLTATVLPTRWLQFDVSAEYQYALVMGDLGAGSSLYVEGQIGIRQFDFRPVARLFISKDSALEFLAILPVYNRVPFEGEISAELGRQGYERTGSGETQIAFDRAWNVEIGVRSSLRPWLFCAIRFAYGPRAELLYGSMIYPTFALEFRF